MKRIAAILLMLILLTGCGDSHSEMDRVMAMRNRLLSGKGCTFDAVVTADYGDQVYTFSMFCQTNAQGDLSFRVTDPKTLAGISGTITQRGGHLTFDDKALAFEMLADGQITPVSAPWVLIHTLRSGYLSACGKDGTELRVAIDDSYEENALHLDVWLTDHDIPLRGDILWQGKRVVSLEVRNFLYV